MDMTWDPGAAGQGTFLKRGFGKLHSEEPAIRVYRSAVSHVAWNQRMKIFKIQIVSLSLGLGFSVLSAQGQGNFQNLGFESGTLVPIPGDPFNRVYFSQAFPGWVGYAGNSPMTAVAVDILSLGAPNISVIDANYPEDVLIAGRYTAVLQSGFHVDTSIAQVGSVPQSAVFLLFKSWGGSQPLVSFDGQNIPYWSIGSGPNYTSYAADASAFAGNVGELRFTAPGNVVNFNAPIGLDSIGFSSVPEPSVFGLAGLSVVVTALVIGRRKRVGIG